MRSNQVTTAPLSAVEANAPDQKGYRRKLLAFLGVATFFEGFEMMALAQLLPALRADFAINEWQVGALVGFINVGTVLAYFLVRYADRWGRRPVLNVTIAGYTVCSLLSGLAPNVYLFALAQLLSRIFLIGEWAVSSVIAAEEFPARERGMALGLINGLAGLGAVVCAGVMPFFLQMPWGWRSVYLFGILPLMLLAVARRGLKETARFRSLSAEERAPSPILRIWSSPYRNRVLLMATVWFLAYLCTNTSVTFFKPYAVENLGKTEKEVSFIISAAAAVSMPLVLAVGYILDRLGRRIGAMLVLGSATVGCLGVYHSTSNAALLAFAVLAVFGSAAVIPTLNAFNTELFPTHLRSDAFAWSNNLLGRIGFVGAPLAVGAAAGSIGWGPAVAATAFGPVLALTMVWLWLPETSGRTLEQTSSLH